MTNNVFNGAAVLILPTQDPEERAARVAEGWFPNKSYQFTVTPSIPTHLPETIRTQLTQQQADLGSVSEILTVYPTA